MIRFLPVLLALLSASAGFAQLKLDESFGSNGARTFALDERSSVVQVLAGTNDTLYVLGTTGSLDTTHGVENLDAVVLKLAPDGVPITSFGLNGVARFDFPGVDVSNVARLELQADGSLLVLGSGRTFANNGYVPFCITRLLPNGTIDASVGSNGVVELPFLGNIDVPRALVRDHENRLIIAGATTDTSQDLRVACVARLLPNLELDTTFGGTGLLALDPVNGLQNIDRHISDGVIYDALVMDDNSVLLAGGDDQAMYFVKLHANGSLDLQFGNSGHLLIHYHSEYINRAVRMQHLPDGTVAFGARLEANFWALKDMLIGRMNPATGSYEVEGADFNSNEDVLQDMTVANNGALVSVGRSIRVENAGISSYQSDYFAVAYTPDYENPQYSQTMLFTLDTTVQTGATAIDQQASGRFVVGGFTNTTTPGTRNLLLLGLVPQNTAVAAPEQFAEAITTYPNPASGHVWLQVGGGQAATAKLIDVAGRVHRKISIAAGGEQVSLAGLLPGMYLLETVDVQGRSATARLLVR